MNTSTVLPRLSNRDSDDANQGCYRKSGRTYNVNLLPPDLRRVYERLKEMNDEDYALTVVFTIKTAVELHRAWQMSLLTSNILQQIKDKFDLRMTWNLGVLELTFRIEDGMYELHRKVPYDYDSEFQNMYYKTAVALVEEDIGVHDALIFQKELKEGKHTCPSGQFLRENPGRLILYSLQAASCSVIFFGGDLRDAGVSAISGFVAGLIEWVLSSKRFSSNVNESKILIDCLVGISTGVIGGLFYKFGPNRDEVCLKAVFLGTLYWFFYGTAFVIGLLEIIASELQTGVTRFLAVAVKTFVLSIGSAIGLTLVLQEDVYKIWTDQLKPESDVCDAFDFGILPPWNPWWRILLYIFCSVTVLGQYRFIIMNYWAGLIVQVAAYLAQEFIKFKLKDNHKFDGMNTVFGDILGAMAAVVTAFVIAVVVDYVRLKSKTGVTDETSMFGKWMQNIYLRLVGFGNYLGLGRNLTSRSLQVRAKLEDKSKKQGKRESEIKLDEEDEGTLVEEAVEAQEYNGWSLLMPAVYQLVPGSKLAMYWYNVILPPVRYESAALFVFNDTDDNVTDDFIDNESEDLASRADSADIALWLTSVSLALGLILGLASVRLIAMGIVTVLSTFRKRSNSALEINEMDSTVLRRFYRERITHEAIDHDPDDGLDSSAIDLLAVSQTKRGQGLRNRKWRTSDT